MKFPTLFSLTYWYLSSSRGTLIGFTVNKSLYLKTTITGRITNTIPDLPMLKIH